MQIETYTQEQRMPTLQEFSDGLCKDNEIEYVELQSQKVASLEKIEIGEAESIFTKLKDYPYEFEINSSLQLASIDGVENKNLKTYIGYPTVISSIEESENKTIFSYTGNAQEYIVPSDGYYRIECWGASGGNAGSCLGGKGAYTSGIIFLSKNEYIYVYVGGSGIDTGVGGSNISGGFNGGGGCGVANAWSNLSTGGGATDIRINSGSCDNFESLKSRIMVAAGGGGAARIDSNGWKNAPGGYGGAIIGGNASCNGTSIYTPPKGATQTSGGLSTNNTNRYMGIFGKAVSANIANYVGAGGGYYGGTSSNTYANSILSGSGGSSFISGYSVCNAISKSSTEDSIVHTGDSLHYSGKYFILSKMLAGNEVMPNYDNTGTMIGNDGNGYVKITPIIFK